MLSSVNYPKSPIWKLRKTYLTTFSSEDRGVRRPILKMRKWTAAVVYRAFGRIEAMRLNNGSPEDLREIWNTLVAISNTRRRRKYFILLTGPGSGRKPHDGNYWIESVYLVQCSPIVYRWFVFRFAVGFFLSYFGTFSNT